VRQASCTVRFVTSPVQRRLAIKQERSAGLVMLIVGVLFLVQFIVRLAADPTLVWEWLMGILGVVQIGAAALGLRRAKRKLTELEREHGPGAGSDEELRSRHGL
jgi:protein-S-isoprenylcysteine O-methyltransferase Ste14